MGLSHIERTQYITQKISEICSYIKLNNNMGHFDTNLFIEDLVLMLLNTTFGYKLENINHKFGKNNVKGIDLIDETNKVCIQISSRTDLDKIKHTLKSVAETEALHDFHIIYFALTDKSPERKVSELQYGDNTFSFLTDYYDFSSILKTINSKPDISCKICHTLNNWIGETPIKEFEKKYSTATTGKLERYYPRTVSVPTENEFNAYFEKDNYPPDTLYNFVSGKVSGFADKKLWLLVSAAQTGKSVETINLLYQLKCDTIHYPIYIKVRDFKDNKDLVLPFYAPVNKMVLILDGFDELPETRRNTLYNLVVNLSSEHSDLKIVITCRRNYVNHSMFANFQRLNLDDLSIEQIKRIIEKNDIDYITFCKELIAQNLWELVFVPFFLESLISIYINDKCLPSNRLDIIRTIVSQSYVADDSINPVANIPSETYGNSMLKQIAYVLQLSEKKELTETDLIDVFKYDKDKISRCLRFAIFTKSEDNKYSFTKNIFLNYFVVLTLFEKTADEILKIVVLRDAEFSCINPAWIDVFELLIASLDSHTDMYRQLVEWMSKHDQQGIINLDPRKLPKQVVISTFKNLLMKYKHLEISGPNDYNYRFHSRLATHCIYHESLELLISEYETTKIRSGYSYLLASMIAFLDADIILASELYANLSNAIFDNIKKNAYSSNNEWYIYVPLENNIFHNSKNVDFLISLYTSKNINLLKAIFSLISKLDDVDLYIGFISENLEDYENYTDEKGVHHLIDHKTMDVIFSKIKTIGGLQIAIYSSINKWIKGRGDTSNAEKAGESYINLLASASRIAENIAENYEDIIEIVEDTWQKILNKHIFYGKVLHTVFYRVKEFVARYNVSNKPSIIIKKMRACLNKENSSREVREYRAIISLYLVSEDIDRIASEMDSTYDNMVILRWINSGLNPEVDERINFWISTKFEQYIFHNSIDWEKHETDSKQVLFDHELFISTIKNLLEKSGDTPVSQYLDELDKREVPTNTYVYWFCQSFEDNIESEYSAKELIVKAQDKHYYDHYRITVIGGHNISIKLSPAQQKELEIAVNNEIENENKSITIICIMVAMRYGLNLPESTILRNLKYAALTSDNYSHFNSEENFFKYAIKHVERQKINVSIQSLLESPDFSADQQHLLQLMTYAIKERLYICIQPILKITCNPQFYYSNIIVDTFNSIGSKGVHVIKDNFKRFPTKLQIYSLKYIRDYEDMQEEIISCMIKIRSNECEEDSRNALFCLLSMGQRDALHDLLDICNFNPEFLGDFHNAPSLKYSSIEHLPILIEILRISSGFTARFNQWPSQCIMAIKNIALTKEENTDTVIDALRSLVSESSDFLWLNYQIESIQQGRLQRHSNPLSVKDAFRLSEG